MISILSISLNNEICHFNMKEFFFLLILLAKKNYMLFRNIWYTLQNAPWVVFVLVFLPLIDVLGDAYQLHFWK